MSEAKVIDIKPEKPAEKAPEKPVKKQVKARFEIVTPTHIVDTWRMVENSLLHGSQLYPDTTEAPREVVQSHLFNYLSTPSFSGLLARVGKRPVGLVLGNLAQRPYGHPSKYAFVWTFWIEPGFRKHGIGQALFKQYTENLKKVGVFHWEAQVQDHLERELVREIGIPMKKLFSTIGGRIL